jgi:hypothetical protein
MNLDQARQQAILLSLLLGLAADPSAPVTAAAFRAIGAVVLFPDTIQACNVRQLV